MSNLAEVTSLVSSIIVPHDRRSPAEWADKNRFLPQGRAFPGQWKSSRTPYMIPLCNDFLDPLVERIVFITGTQAGKTANIFNVLGWILTDRPSPAIFYGPTQSKIDNVIEPEFMTMIKQCPDLLERYASGKKSNRHIKRISGVSVRFGWAGSASELSSDAAQYIFVDELDRPDRNASGEGDIVELAEARGESYHNSKLMLTSTPTNGFVETYIHPITGMQHWATGDESRIDSPIWHQWQAGTRHEWAVPCQHCGEYFVPRSELLFLGSDEKGPGLTCFHCGAINTEDMRQEKNRLGVFVAPGQSVSKGGAIIGKSDTDGNTTVSRWVSGLCSFSSKKTYKFLGRKLKAANIRENTDTLLSLYNTGFGECWAPKIGDERSADVLESRAQGENWTRGHVPRGTRFLLASIDVQHRGFVVQVFGFSVGLEWWLVDRYEITQSERNSSTGDPESVNPATHPEDWNLIVSKVMKREYPLDDGSGRNMPIRMTLCDSGGRAGVTARAYAFYRRLRRQGLHSRFRLVKGDAGAKDNTPRVRETFPDSSRRKDRSANARGEIPVLLLNTLVLKDSVAADLQREEAGSGCGHLPEWTPQAIFEEMTAEVRTSKKWEKPSGAANEAWDLTVYAKAGALFLGAETWGEEWEDAPFWAKEIMSGDQGLAHGKAKPQSQADDGSGHFGSKEWQL